MKRVKIIGFKVGDPYPTFNRTIRHDQTEPITRGIEDVGHLGNALYKALQKSDFISIRWVT